MPTAKNIPADLDDRIHEADLQLGRAHKLITALREELDMVMGGTRFRVRELWLQIEVLSANSRLLADEMRRRCDDLASEGCAYDKRDWVPKERPPAPDEPIDVDAQRPRQQIT